MDALLASPLALLIGVSLGALGGGGSILIVPVLVFAVGQSPNQATTTSLVVVGIASATGAVAHWRQGRVRTAAAIVFGLVGVAGSLAGSMVNRRLDGDVLLLGFAGLMLVAAWRIVAGCPSCTRVGERRALQLAGDPGQARVMVTSLPATATRLAEIAGAATAVGFLTGLFGIGGGFVVVPALALVLQYSMPEAIGTSLLVVAVNAATAFGARLGQPIDWTTTVVFAAAATVGVGAGARLTGRLDPASMQRGFAGLLVAVALYTGTHAAVAIW
ncbi:MAG TPA: sulfite exporter TauE/SafE family protein [Acidimicrobiales bacterium]